MIKIPKLKAEEGKYGDFTKRTAYIGMQFFLLSVLRIARRYYLLTKWKWLPKRSKAALSSSS